MILVECRCEMDISFHLCVRDERKGDGGKSLDDLTFSPFYHC